MYSKNKNSIWMINFDLDTIEIKNLFPNENISKRYQLIKDFFLKNNFKHIQGSGYITKEKITKNNLLGILNNLFIQEPLFLDYVNKFSISAVLEKQLVFNSKKALEDYFNSINQDSKLDNNNILTEEEDFFRKTTEFLDKLEEKDKEKGLPKDNSLESPSIDEKVIKSKKSKTL